MYRLLVTANASSSLTLTLMMEALRFSETSVLTRAAWHNIPEDAILQHKTVKKWFIKNYMKINVLKQI
jgi:hypothetical protein